MTVRIVCDTACDLPQALADQLGILLVPLHVRFGGTEMVDREELSTKEFWARCAQAEELPETSAPAPGSFQRAFETASAAGAEGIVCVSLSSRLSATNEAAAQAVRAFVGPPVAVVDSLSATLGEGLVALAAAEAAAEGAGMAEVVSRAEAARDRLFVFGAIDTLDNLRKGGRIGGAAAALGALLSIKPVIEVRNGVVEQESKQRTRARSRRYLADKVLGAGPLERLAVMGADAPDFDHFVASLGDARPAHPLLVGEIGPVIGTHAGPGALGVAWVAASRN
ncbi:MAG: DegV family protein [Acidimicrobiales bacterium]